MEEGGQRNGEGKGCEREDGRWEQGVGKPGSIGKVRGVGEREKKEEGGAEKPGRYREGKGCVGERGWKIGRRRSRKV